MLHDLIWILFEVLADLPAHTMYDNAVIAIQSMPCGADCSLRAVLDFKCLPYHADPAARTAYANAVAAIQSTPCGAGGFGAVPPQPPAAAAAVASASATGRRSLQGTPYRLSDA